MLGIVLSNIAYVGYLSANQSFERYNNENYWAADVRFANSDLGRFLKIKKGKKLVALHQIDKSHPCFIKTAVGP